MNTVGNFRHCRQAERAFAGTIPMRRAMVSCTGVEIGAAANDG